jgi:hypothetical protein
VLFILNQDNNGLNALMSFNTLQRAEDSENRIKELKNDFGAKQMPCADFNANALYFDICSLSYNLFALVAIAR